MVTPEAVDVFIHELVKSAQMGSGSMMAEAARRDAMQRLIIDELCDELDRLDRHVKRSNVLRFLRDA